jgi:hypothetical protein
LHPAVKQGGPGAYGPVCCGLGDPVGDCHGCGVLAYPVGLGAVAFCWCGELRGKFSADPLPAQGGGGGDARKKARACCAARAVQLTTLTTTTLLWGSRLLAPGPGSRRYRGANIACGGAARKP